MRRLFLFLAVPVLAMVLASCSTTPQPSAAPVADVVAEPPPAAIQPVEAPIEAPAQPVETPKPEEPVPSFDPAKVTVEVKQATFFDAKALVEKLNAIIMAKDFDTWKGYLTEEYVAYWSNPVNLAGVSELTVKRFGIKIETLRDYFLNVVCLSRQNARLDDITFISADMIMAMTIRANGETAVLYYLEKKNDTWKIGIGR